MARPSPMVMRSVYLPEDMDLHLRHAAFALNRPKADLIRAFVTRGLAALPKDIERLTPTQRNEHIRQIFGDTEPVSELEARAYEDDLDRLSESAPQSGKAGRRAAE